MTIKYLKLNLFFLVFTVSFLISPYISFSKEVKQNVTITYTVKKGDTLWGLSKKFFDSHWYWPGLWAENGEIKNPHWIYPGQKITLYNKTALENLAKEKKVTKKKAVEILKPVKKTEPPKKPNFVYRKINKLPFILDKPLVPFASVKQGVKDAYMYTIGDEVYLLSKDKSEKFLIGEKYAIYTKPIKVNSPADEDKLIGYQYSLAAIIEILKKEGSLLRAVITNAYRPVTLGDLVTEFNEISPDIFLKPSKDNIQGIILKEKEGGNYLGEKYTGFINLGTKNGMQRGQIYSVVEKQKIRIGKIEKTELVPFASFVILDTRKTTSSILVIEAQKQIPVGSLFVSPSML